MPHLLIEPNNQRFAIAVSPKVGCTSIRHWMWEVGTGEEYNGENIYQSLPYQYFQNATDLPASIRVVIAVHRSGLSRMRSIYDHRIRVEKDVEDLGIVHFANHIQEYCSKSGTFAHHCIQQWHWLGSSPGVYTDILPLGKLGKLPEIVGKAIGEKLHELPRIHQTTQKSDLTHEVIPQFEQWTELDTIIGWDGETSLESSKPTTDETIATETERDSNVEKKERQLLGWLDKNRVSPLIFSRSNIEQSAELDGLELSGKYEGLKKWGWYLDDLAGWRDRLATPRQVKILEIGAFDGVSANMMLDYLFPHPNSVIHCIDPFLIDPTTPEVSENTQDRFLENQARRKNPDAIKLYEGISVEVLAWMIAGEGFWESFDFIYIDGSHTADNVLTDAVMSWPLLKSGGVIAFDDYEWEGNGQLLKTPRPAIDAFESIFCERLNILREGWRKIWQKI